VKELEEEVEVLLDVEVNVLALELLELPEDKAD
jgi:hypothetical protein